MKRLRNIGAMLVLLIGISACAQSSADVQVEDAPVQSTPAVAVPLPAPVRYPRAVVQAVDFENDIYVLALGSSDDVRAGAIFEVEMGDEPPYTVVVDRVFKNHCSARRQLAPPEMCDLHPQLRDDHYLVDVDAVVSSIAVGGERIVIAAGSLDHVADGVEFTIHREGEYIATVVVVEVHRDVSVGELKEGLTRKAVRVGDRASTLL